MTLSFAHPFFLLMPVSSISLRFQLVKSVYGNTRVLTLCMTHSWARNGCFSFESLSKIGRQIWCLQMRAYQNGVLIVILKCACLFFFFFSNLTASAVKNPY